MWVRSQRLPPRLDPADDRILDRDHARVGLSFLDRAYGAAECRYRNLIDRMAPDLRDRAFGVRAAVALKCDAHRQVAYARASASPSGCVRLGAVGVRFRSQHGRADYQKVGVGLSPSGALKT